MILRDIAKPVVSDLCFSGGLAFTSQGRAIVGLDMRKPRRNLVLLEPSITQLRGRAARS
jgi:hypothetical protein